MNRREFLGRSAVVGATMSLPHLGRADEPSPRPPKSGQSRPNILFIWTDQQSAHAMSNAGNPWLHTPAMDELAAQGVTFKQTYCSDPICVPSRASWLTGQMPHRTGVTFNTEEGGVVGAPLSRRFAEQGYDTGYVGKWHIPHAPDDKAWHGFEFTRHMRNNRLDPDVLPACNEFLRTPRDHPFFLVASFLNPHDICEWARLAAGGPDVLPNGQLPPAPPPEACPPLPDNFEIPAGEPDIIRTMQARGPKLYPTVGWPEGRWRQYLWAYYRLIERVDAQVGAILQTLRETGQDENTVIVFSSDHGDGAASHRWNQKTLFYEEVAKVPFIVRPPACARAGQRDDHSLVNLNLDFFPTVFDYAGLPATPGLPGRSVRGLIEGQPGATGHPFVISQNEITNIYGASEGVYGRMLRTARYKYVRFSTGEKREQLFDLTDDPGEMQDLVTKTSHTDVLAEHRTLLDDWMRREDDHIMAG
ncbi:sulfatase family protein [Synoicihabitans lomoniglobus]|uniref:Sulfatase-like hydrolase/transferase n=1 Tax=Synoicihabitans lomoniglobus TaxID=2909285 RepID=A0AAF0CNH6_9BACT|nr:sulfatase-like hydrolase/transferase [Opitutaceae bacterium LMO-M01]WED64430.1 sulfatase-like hydrolase/transferase [Opitutaceae bacterium LMO-M01]